MLLSDRVLFLDGEALVIDKPAGLPVDAPRDGSISLENHLDLLKFGFKRWPLAVHRLDRDTSGCLLDRKSTRLTPVTNAHLVCRLLLEKKKNNNTRQKTN